VVAARTTDELITAIDSRCLLPSADGRLTSTEKLEFATQRLSSTIAEVLATSRSARWAQAGADTTIVSGTYLYEVPERALAAGIFDVVFTDGTNETSMDEVELEEAVRYRASRGSWEGPYAYAWLDDKVELLPHPSSSSGTGYLRFYYPRQPSKLVPVASCAIITASNATTITATSAQTILGSTATIDVVKGAPNGSPRGLDLSATISGNTITVTTPSGVVAGDYACLAGTTCVVPMPQALWPVLVTAASADVQGALGDTQAQAVLQQQLSDALANARSIMQPRSKGERQVIVSPNTPLRARRGWR
jgi:hypothetical protein